MQYREMRKAGMKVSEIGLGCEHLQGKDAREVDAVISEAINGGINVMDVFMSEPNVRSAIGASLKGRRDKVVLEGHFGPVWVDGQYGRSRETEMNRVFFEDLLTRYQTDYLDIGMVHFVDTMAEYEQVMEGPVMAYLRSLKREGRVRAIGMSAHAPETALRAVKEGLIDVLLFSINPAYDLAPASTNVDDLVGANTLDPALAGVDPQRAALYTACEEAGVGITVMKPFGAGTLLNSALSPFGRAMTTTQLLHYALTRPGVCAVMAGAQTVQEVQTLLAYETADQAARDYVGVLGDLSSFHGAGRCMYCNHCHPCSMHIDVAAVGRYLDLAVATGVTDTLRDHYLALGQTGGDCIECGQCVPRCPFGVDIPGRMKQAEALFE